MRQCDAHVPLVGEGKQGQQRCQPQPTHTSVVTQLDKRTALAQSSVRAKQLRLPPGARRRLHVHGGALPEHGHGGCCRGLAAIAIGIGIAAQLVAYTPRLM